MDCPRIQVDFNEMVESNLVLLSQGDTELDSSGNTVVLREGLYVYIYSDDVDASGASDPLLAEGVVERAPATGWAAAAKWCCRIGPAGIIHASDRAHSAR